MLNAAKHGHGSQLACRVSDTDTRKSMSDTPNEVSNILIFFRTRGHGKNTRRTRQGHGMDTCPMCFFFFLKKSKTGAWLLNYSLLQTRTLSHSKPKNSSSSRCRPPARPHHATTGRWMLLACSITDVVGAAAYCLLPAVGCSSLEATKPRFEVRLFGSFS